MRLRTNYRLTLTDAGDPLSRDRDAAYRMKILAKQLLRYHGFKLTAIEGMPGQYSVRPRESTESAPESELGLST